MYNKLVKQAFSLFTMILVLLVVNGFSQDVNQGTSQVEKTKPDTTEISQKSPTGAMIRSMLFPGLGQWYNNKKIKAIVFFCGETALLANAIYLNQKVVQSQDDWDREFYINNRNLSVWWLVGVILFSMGDAFVDAHLANFDESPILTVAPVQNSYIPQNKAWSLSLSLRW